jgi:D-sedoheptulose 7-phosphate isomerase
VARNLGHAVTSITTANFDLLPLGDYARPVSTSDPAYYYRPRKNVVNRPTSLGGQGYHVTGDHRVTIPNLYRRVIAVLGGAGDKETRRQGDKEQEASNTQLPISNLQSVVPDGVIADLVCAFHELARCFRAGGTLFLCGNGGSMADALHVSGELAKSYVRRRPLPERLHARLAAQPDGELLARNLEPGLRAVVLGANPSLASAVANDAPDRDVNLAQELLALARPGDMLLGISTSGNARNVLYAAQTARALGLTVIALTGEDGGRLAELADVTVRVPARRTDRVQELHVQCYHALCEMLEIEFFAQEQS